MMHRRPISLLLLFILGVSSPALAGDKKNKDKKKHNDPAEIGSRDLTKGKWNFYSADEELSLGRELAKEAERTSHLLRDPLVVAYVTEIGERVARNSDLSFPIQVRVIDSAEVNAFALPGGYFFITTGMLLETQSEAELAGIIGHEIGHVAARHATRQMTRSHIWSIVSLPLVFVGGQVAYAIYQGTQLAVPLAFLKFSRDSEREADQLGLQYSYASGYDPVAVVDFLERMKAREKQKEGGIAKVFASHPMTKDRVVAAEKTIEQLPDREEYVVTTWQHAEMTRQLRKLLREHERLEYALRPALRRRPIEIKPPRIGEPDGF
jgi:predicted Zn-dependent protease